MKTRTVVATAEPEEPRRAALLARLARLMRRRLRWPWRLVREERP